MRQIDGVLGADISFATGVLVLDYDPASDPREAVVAAIRSSGHAVEPLKETVVASVRFRLAGIDCADCAAKLGKQMALMPGVASADVDFGTAVLRVDYDSSSTDPTALARAIRDAGYAIESQEGQAGPTLPPPTWWQQHGQRASLIASGVLIAGGYGFALLGQSGPVRATASILFVLAAVVGGTLTARRAVSSLKARSLDMNVLMAVAVVGAIVLGDYAEGAMVVFLFSVGQYLESRSLARTRASIRDLIDLTPATAKVRRAGREIEVRPEQAVLGDTLVVRPGERIALDGVVVSGSSAVDEAPITGEAVPVSKSAQDKVFAGTLNGSGLLEVEVTRVAADSTLARIVFLVEEAQASRAPSQQLVDRFSRFYTPLVLLAAVVVAVLPPLLGLGTFADWFYRALVMLVVSCPCALVISTPVAIVSAITRATRAGLLVKGGVFLETAAAVQAVAFDKTGTLTLGRPVVTATIPLAEPDADRVLELAAALEAGSTHPLAEAVLRAHGGGIATGRVTGITDVPGRGVTGSIDGREYSIGSPAMAMDAEALDLSVMETIEQLETEGQTVLVLFAAQQVLGLVAAADEVRPEAAHVVRALRQGGVRHVVMLTGDNDRTASAIAALAGVTEHRARLLPEDKVAAIHELRARYGTVAMIGDGINDAPALAAADIGIAMGAAGSDTALETADVALMAAEITPLPGFLALGRRTVGIIRSNVVFSIVTKSIVLVLAVLGYAPLWLAVFADTGVSLLVTLNGLRLLRNGSMRVT